MLGLQSVRRTCQEVENQRIIYYGTVGRTYSYGYTTTSTISDSVSQIAKQLKPQFDELGSAYTSIFTEDGMDLEIVDNAMMDSLLKTFGEIEDEIGVAFDSSLLNEFFDVLTDSTSTVDDVQAAFDDLATAYFCFTDTLSYLVVGRSLWKR